MNSFCNMPDRTCISFNKTFLQRIIKFKRKDILIQWNQIQGVFSKGQLLMNFFFLQDLLTSNSAAWHKVQKVFPLEAFRFIILDLTCNEFHEARLRAYKVYDFWAFRLQGVGREKPQLCTTLL
uniref:Similar to ATVPS33 (Arabidopsis thaliana vacuolar protein sorting 33) n=1 Tax=Arundo donax TaxID=35708 RepID=A0A0A9DQ37_ARUDO